MLWWMGIPGERIVLGIISVIACLGMFYIFHSAYWRQTGRAIELAAALTLAWAIMILAPIWAVALISQWLIETAWIRYTVAVIVWAILESIITQIWPSVRDAVAKLVI